MQSVSPMGTRISYFNQYGGTGPCICVLLRGKILPKLEKPLLSHDITSPPED